MSLDNISLLAYMAQCWLQCQYRNASLNDGDKFWETRH